MDGIEKETLGSCMILQPSKTIKRQNANERRLCDIACLEYDRNQSKLQEIHMQEQRRLR